MTRTVFPGRRPRRRGAILLVVLALLALFAVIGLSFALYAESEANAARIHRDAVARQPDTPPDPTQVVNSIFQQAVYGTTDRRSSFRGHDMVTLLYGGQGGTVPYSGVGTFSLPIDPTQVNLFQTTGVLAFDRKDAINYAAWDSPYTTGPTDTTAQARTTIVDPETAYVVSSPAVTGFGSLATGTALSTPTNATGIYVPKNAPYTYPDRNNALLAVLDSTSGLVRVVSGHRDGLFNDLGGGMGATNPNWYNVTGHFKTLRVRPFDHLLPGERSAALSAVGLTAATLGTVTPAQAGQLAALAQSGQLGQFPFPVTNPEGSVTGDVQNLIYSTANPTGGVTGQQRMDAVWINPNLPLATYKGKTIATLVAPTLIALDGRVNLNAAGNLVVTSNTHGSHSGFGPHEINLGTVLESTGSGTPAVPASTYAQQIVQKRYGSGSVPPAPRELPNSSDVTYLGTTATGYPYYPNYPAVTQAYGAKPFHLLPAGLSQTNPPVSQKAALVVNQLQPPDSMAVNWSGLNQPYSLPGLDSTAGVGRFRTGPKFSNYKNSSYAGAVPPSGPPTTSTGEVLDHPLLWNPYRRDEFAVGSATTRAGEVFGLFPVGDLRSTGRYADRSARLRGETVIGSNVPALFGSDLPVFQGHHANARVTPISNSRAAGGLAANFFGDPNVRLKLPSRTAAFDPVTNPLVPPQLSAAPQFNLTRMIDATPSTGVAIAANAGATDTPDATNTNNPAGVPANTNLASARGRLGPIDLNRPLPDYTGTNTSLSNTSVTAGSAAELDARNARQRLAYDIFIRLAVATGASVRWDSGTSAYVLPQPSASGYEFTSAKVTGLNPSPLAVDATEYNALRWLAQYAANVVDAIDSDDVSTPFVWNPVSAADAQNATNFGTGADTNGQTYLANRVVFGVEKPRVVLNEVHAELTNDEQDTTTTRNPKPFQARFFVELLNPSSYDSTSPQPQNVPLGYPGTVPSYQLQVYDDSAGVRNSLTGSGSEGNVLGTPPATSQKINLSLNDAALTTMVGVNGVYDDNGNPTGNPAYNLEPNSGQFQADTPTTAGTTPHRRGFGMIGPGSRNGSNQALKDDNYSYRPDVTTYPFNMMIQKPLSSPTTGSTGVESEMAYFITAGNQASIDTAGAAHTLINTTRHAVVLRRLANPYIPESATNPYLTVDTVYGVKVQDSVYVATAPGTAPPAVRTPGTQRATRHSIGRVQPFAGLTGTTDPYNPAVTTKYQSLTVQQKPNPAETAYIQQTFMRHNSTNSSAAFQSNPTSVDTTLDFPSEWFTHLDRRVINAEELLHVAAVRPHELTAQFAKLNPSGTGRTVTHLHEFGRWVDPAANTGGSARDATEAAIVTASPLYRALDLLMPKPWMHDVPLAGRAPGRVNVNMIWDKKVFEALLDQNAGSSFSGPTTTTPPPVTDVDQMWQDFMRSRSPKALLGGSSPYNIQANVPFVGDTVDEAAAGPGGALDRPFKGFGAPRFDIGVGSNRLGASNADDTLLRTAVDGTGKRLLFARQGQLTRFGDPNDPTHPYRDNEALRKILNNVTTTSDTFLLVFTVGYFEVRAGTYNDPTNPIVLGKEVFNNAPGDLRAKFAAVIDRTHLAQTDALADPFTGVAAPWNMDLQSEITGLTVGGSAAAQVLLAPPLGVDRTGWDPSSGPDAIPPGQVGNAELHYSVKAPVTGQQDEYYIAPRYNRFSNPGQPTYPDTDPRAYREYVLTGRYEGRDFTISARWMPLPSPGQSNGTVFYIGTGRKRTKVQAYYDGSLAKRWSYNPVTGMTRIYVQVVGTVGEDTGTETYAPGTILSSVVFGSPTGATLDVTTASPVVPFFTRLTP